MTSFFSALTYPFRGVTFFLGRPALWKYFAAALAINVVLFAVMIYLFLHYRTELIDALLPARWWGWLRAGLGWAHLPAQLLLGLFVGRPVRDIRVRVADRCPPDAPDLGQLSLWHS